MIYNLLKWLSRVLVNIPNCTVLLLNCSCKYPYTLPNWQIFVTMIQTINDVVFGVTQAGLSRYLNRRYGEFLALLYHIFLYVQIVGDSSLLCSTCSSSSFSYNLCHSIIYALVYFHVNYCALQNVSFLAGENQRDSGLNHKENNLPRSIRLRAAILVNLRPTVGIQVDFNCLSNSLYIN